MPITAIGLYLLYIWLGLTPGSVYKYVYKYMYVYKHISLMYKVV